MRLSALRRRLDACLRLHRDEQGIALVMALGILTVLTLALATVIFMTSAGARDAKRTNAGQKAYAAAEAGLNNLIAEIAPHYPSGSAGSASWAAAGSGSYEGATSSWSATFVQTSSTDGTYHLTGTGTVTNPTGPGSSNVVRVVKSDLAVSAGAGFPFGVYSGDPNANCTTLSGGITVNVPVYVASCLTLSGNFSGYDAKIWQPSPYTPATVTVQTGKALTVTGGTQIGTPARPVKNIWYGTTCSASPCNSANGYNSVNPVSSPGPAQSGLPTVNAATIYSSVPWGSASCTGINPFDNDGTRNNSKGNVDITTLASYNCSVTDSAGQVHSISYNSATHALAIQNSWFIDGNLAIGTHNGLKYTGDGTIYFNGTVTNQGVVCGPGSTYTAPETCGKTWDPTMGQLLFVAINASASPASPSFTLSAASCVMEADSWAVGNASANVAFMSSSQVWLGGSVFTDKGYASISGNGVIHSYLTLPSGAPSNWTLSLHPSNYRGG